MSFNKNGNGNHKFTSPAITVMGLGGGGCNSVNRLHGTNTMEEVRLVVANTDMQSLKKSNVDYQLQLGAKSTKGLGAGADPAVGAKAAEESIEEIRECIEGSDMLFLTAGMGGGTGSGSIAKVAQLAKEMGILTVAIVTTPFNFEGAPRANVAKRSIAELKKACETVIVIHNQNLLAISNSSTTLSDAFQAVDNTLLIAIKSIADLVIQPGIINCDFADIKNTMRAKGRAMMGIGQAAGENRALIAAQAAINNPLLDQSKINSATNLLVTVSAGKDLTLQEVDEAINEIKRAVQNEDCVIIFGAVEDPTAEYITVSLVATGIKDISDVDLHERSGLANNRNILNPFLYNNKVASQSFNNNPNFHGNDMSFNNSDARGNTFNTNSREEQVAATDDYESGLPSFLRTRNKR